MTGKRKDDASVSDEIESLTREAEELRLQQETVVEQIKALRGQESQAEGVCHAQEIFRLSQEKLRLATEIDFRKAKANRLRLGASSGLLQ